MTIKPKSDQVPNQMQPTYRAITTLTDDFCQKHLNEEYARLAQQLTAALCRKRPSPLTKGKPNSWACGIIYALGFVNFLFDRSQTPSMSAAELCAAFSVSKSTGANKSAEIRRLMDMSQFDPNWCLPSLMDQNPLAWLITVNGLIVDARHMPLAVQQEAYEKGLIPYIPGQPVSADAGRSAASKPATNDQALYTLEAFIISGPVTKAFIKRNPVMSRTIEIRGDQTLAQLHTILFQAFERVEEHLYEFQFKGTGPTDPNAEKYLPPAAVGPGAEADIAGLTTQTKLGSLGLSVGEPFGYWFDFGDDWWHQINVLAIAETSPPGQYPRVIKRKGASPPQYPS